MIMAECTEDFPNGADKKIRNPLLLCLPNQPSSTGCLATTSRCVPPPPLRLYNSHQAAGRSLSTSPRCGAKETPVFVEPYAGFRNGSASTICINSSYEHNLQPVLLMGSAHEARAKNGLAIGHLS